ncbi:neutral zinc metallopeptidase [Roseiterribacter gracilis]|uniref:Membrane protein n=1 Tax=Roseiterribacter gracilis TaxID=2812848 RepID=A0A8S8XE06_9PROT|nr:membrane protein [Rhodospirillales bacterium TMPK1]
MQLDGGRESDNVVDARGAGGGGGKLIGGGIGTIAILLIGWFLGVDPSLLLDVAQQASAPQQQQSAQVHPAGEDLRFEKLVLARTEDVWSQAFQQMGRTYRAPRLEVFHNPIPSGCGMAQSVVGPFYCPRDQTIYLDKDFLDQLMARFGVRGEFAKAYVIAHEVGHHVQHQLGLLNDNAAPTQGAQGTSVRTELQADCLAGVWATRSDKQRKLLDPGDIESGIAAASAVGDDRLQRSAGRQITPDAFTHGTAAQRVHWFRRGVETGDPRACDTFHANPL